MEEGTSILDVFTLYEYDYADYLYQEHARFRDFPKYKGSGYSMEYPIPGGSVY